MKSKSMAPSQSSDSNSYSQQQFKLALHTVFNKIFEEKKQEAGLKDMAQLLIINSGKREKLLLTLEGIADLIRKKSVQQKIVCLRIMIIVAEVYNVMVLSCWDQMCSIIQYFLSNEESRLFKSLAETVGEIVQKAFLREIHESMFSEEQLLNFWRKLIFLFMSSFQNSSKLVIKEKKQALASAMCLSVAIQSVPRRIICKDLESLCIEILRPISTNKINYNTNKLWSCENELLECILCLVVSCEEQFESCCQYSVPVILDSLYRQHILELPEQNKITKKLCLDLLYTLSIVTPNYMCRCKQECIEIISLFTSDPSNQVKETAILAEKFIYDFPEAQQMRHMIFSEYALIDQPRQYKDKQRMRDKQVEDGESYQKIINSHSFYQQYNENLEEERDEENEFNHSNFRRQECHLSEPHSNIEQRENEEMIKSGIRNQYGLKETNLQNSLHDRKMQNNQDQLFHQIQYSIALPAEHKKLIDEEIELGENDIQKNPLFKSRIKEISKENPYEIKVMEYIDKVQEKVSHPQDQFSIREIQNSNNVPHQRSKETFADSEIQYEEIEQQILNLQSLQEQDHNKVNCSSTNKAKIDQPKQEETYHMTYIKQVPQHEKREEEEQVNQQNPSFQIYEEQAMIERQIINYQQDEEPMIDYSQFPFNQNKNLKIENEEKQIEYNIPQSDKREKEENTLIDQRNNLNQESEEQIISKRSEIGESEALRDSKKIGLNKLDSPKIASKKDFFRGSFDISVEDQHEYSPIEILKNVKESNQKSKQPFFKQINLNPSSSLVITSLQYREDISEKENSSQEGGKDLFIITSQDTSISPQKSNFFNAQQKKQRQKIFQLSPLTSRTCRTSSALQSSRDRSTYKTKIFQDFPHTQQGSNTTSFQVSSYSKSPDDSNKSPFVPISTQVKERYQIKDSTSTSFKESAQTMESSQISIQKTGCQPFRSSITGSRKKIWNNSSSSPIVSQQGQTQQQSQNNGNKEQEQMDYPQQPQKSSQSQCMLLQQEYYAPINYIQSPTESLEGVLSNQNSFPLRNPKGQQQQDLKNLNRSISSLNQSQSSQFSQIQIAGENSNSSSVVMLAGPECENFLVRMKRLEGENSNLKKQIENHFLLPKTNLNILNLNPNNSLPTQNQVQYFQILQPQEQISNNQSNKATQRIQNLSSLQDTKEEWENEEMEALLQELRSQVKELRQERNIVSEQKQLREEQLQSVILKQGKQLEQLVEVVKSIEGSVQKFPPISLISNSEIKQRNSDFKAQQIKQEFVSLEPPIENKKSYILIDDASTQKEKVLVNPQMIEDKRQKIYNNIFYSSQNSEGKQEVIDETLLKMESAITKSIQNLKKIQEKDARFKYLEEEEVEYTFQNKQFDYQELNTFGNANNYQSKVDNKMDCSVSSGKENEFTLQDPFPYQDENNETFTHEEQRILRQEQEAIQKSHDYKGAFKVVLIEQQEDDLLAHVLRFSDIQECIQQLDSCDIEMLLKRLETLISSRTYLELCTNWMNYILVYRPNLSSSLQNSLKSVIFKILSESSSQKEKDRYLRLSQELHSKIENIYSLIPK